MGSAFFLTDQVDSMQILNTTSASMSFKVVWESGESPASEWFGPGDSRSLAFSSAGIPLGSECVALIEFEDAPPHRVEPAVYYASGTATAGVYVVGGDPGSPEVQYMGARPSPP